MILVLGWLLGGTAHAASLDLLDVGGLWGTPATHEATAVLWNPGGLGVGEGTRILVEGAPVFATVSFDRVTGEQTGLQRYRYFGVVPYLGVVTDAGVDGLGLGFSLSVPQARGATAVDPEGPGRMHLRRGDIKAIHVTGAVGYDILGKIGLGASVSYVLGTWAADLDTEVASALADELVAANGGTQTDYYPDDAVLEDTRYRAVTGFGPLTAHDVSFAVGFDVHPIDLIDIAVSYQHGWRADHRGPVSIAFDCPPDTDAVGRFGAEDRGLCNADMSADGVVSYRYPSRVYAGIAVKPVDGLRVEAYGGWVGWRAFKDFAITLDQVQSANTTIDEHTAELVGKDKLWARDNRNSFFVGLDAKYRVLDRYRVGVRASFDRAAVPDEVLSPNNYDADTIALGGMFGVTVLRQLEIGLSFTEYLSVQRSTTTSAYSLAIDPAARADGRYFYAPSGGTYGSAIHRLGVSFRVDLDGSAKAVKRRARDAADAPALDAAPPAAPQTAPPAPTPEALPPSDDNCPGEPNPEPGGAVP